MLATREHFSIWKSWFNKHAAVAQVGNVKQVHKNVEFFFANKSHASKFVSFFGQCGANLNHGDKQLVSKDSKSNTYNYKYTLSIQVFPICKKDLICLPLIIHSSLLVSIKSVGVRTLCSHRWLYRFAIVLLYIIKLFSSWLTPITLNFGSTTHINSRKFSINKYLP